MVVPIYLESKLNDEMVRKKVSVVVDIIVHNSGRHLGKPAIHQEWVLLDWALDPSTRKLTVFDAVLVKIDGRFGLSTRPFTKFFVHPPQEITGVSNVVEACAGIGAMGRVSHMEELQQFATRIAMNSFANG